MRLRSALSFATALTLANCGTCGVANTADAAASAPIFPASSATPAAARFQVSPDGQEVADTQTHLVWRRCVEGMTFDGTTCKGKPKKYKFGDAKKAAAAAGAGWRVPTKDELMTLIAKTKNGARIDLAAFPATPATLTWGSRPGFDDDLNAWIVNFSNGRVVGNSGLGSFVLRLVKAG